MVRIKRDDPEAREMRALIEWAAFHPICKEYLFHVPNGGSRNLFEARDLKRQGVKAGVSDLFLAYPSNGFHGLFVEMKRADGKGKITKAQLKWLNDVIKVGYVGIIAIGWEEAVMIIKHYLKPRVITHEA